MLTTNAHDPSPRRRRRPVLVLAAGGCVAVLAACGSASSGGSGTTGSGSPSPKAYAAGLKFSDCMRSHGVPNFPDPGSGGGIQINSASGINPQSPAFQSAQKACGKLLPGGGPGSQHATEASKLAMLKLAECMRSHGLTTFPDPTSTPPTPGVNGASLVLGRGGVFLALPSSVNPQSPEFQKAAVACHFPMPHGKPTAAPG